MVDLSDDWRSLNERIEYVTEEIEVLAMAARVAAN
jgi:hypothetical protein